MMADGELHGTRFLAFLAGLVLRAEKVETSPEDPSPPPLRLREKVFQHADRLGSLLESVLAAGCSSPAQLKQLVGTCAIISSALAKQTKLDDSDDGFTLACRVLLQTCLTTGCGDAADAVVMLPALA